MIRFAGIVGLLLLLCGAVVAQDLPLPDPQTPEASEAQTAPDPTEDLSAPVKIVLILTALTVLPALVMTVTSFTRIIIVLSFVRKALSVQEMPPNQVLIGLALFLTIIVMNPVIGEVNDQALQPYLDEQISLKEAADRGATSLSGFLLAQTRNEDLVLMVDLTRMEKPETPEDAPLHVLVPAFALSELRTAFQMGFLVYLPFLVVDLVVASVLLSMGMFMLPPVIISTPFKILLFILVDGWDLVVRSLVQSFQGG
ncbi:MAG: flagellar type III secretion system pore protein FliP [Planctomycetes bacterium]|nr:flagellar type III secretion system pore protein FliP [Planctomycetota bacterium]